MRAQLAALDPEQMCLRDIKALGEAPTEADVSGGGASAAPSRTPLIRVPSEKVDDLMAEIGEMRSALATLADILHNGGIAQAMREIQRRDSLSAREGADWRQYREAIDTDLRDLRALAQHARRRASPHLERRPATAGHSR